MSFPRTISVTGSGRSGTNILKKVFSNHSQIATLPFEYRFVIDPLGIVDFYQTFNTSRSPYRIDQKIKELESFLHNLEKVNEDKVERTLKAQSYDKIGTKLTGPSYAGWELNKWIPAYESFVNELIDDLVSFDYSAVWPGSEEAIENNRMYYSTIKSKDELCVPLRQFLKKCVDSVLRIQNKQVFLEDNTHNILYANDLCKLMPGLKHVHMVRDPRDVISSLKSQRWAPSKIEHLIEWYNDIMEAWFYQKFLLSSDQFLEVKFETFIESPIELTNQICDFTGLIFQNSMTQIDLSKHNIGRYKEDLSNQEINLIETKLSDVMVNFHYE